jgi:hypothetical protein
LLQQVTALTETVTAQAKRLDDLHAFNSRILDEKKDAQRKANFLEDHLAKEARKRELAVKGLKETEDGRVVLDSSELPAHTISRADARDPVLYRAAKEAAAKAGVPLRIADDRDDPTRRNTHAAPDIAQTKTISLDDDHHRIRYVRADHQTGSGIVQRRLEAERQGFKVQTWRTPDDLPEHMQAKLHLMEKAHEADT